MKVGFIAVFALFVGVVSFSCQAPIFETGTKGLKVSIALPAALSSDLSGGGRFLLANGTGKVVISVSGIDFQAISVNAQRIPGTNTYSVDFIVPKGPNRTFQIRAFDQSNTVYAGIDKNVDIDDTFGSQSFVLVPIANSSNGNSQMNVFFSKIVVYELSVGTGATGLSLSVTDSMYKFNITNDHLLLISGDGINRTSLTYTSSYGFSTPATVPFTLTVPYSSKYYLISYTDATSSTSDHSAPMSFSSY